VAYAHTTTNKEFPIIYNVEQAVGPTGANVKGDVKLVQYLLRGIYSVPGRPAPIAVDGYVGPITNSYILAFQKAMKSVGNNVLTDGRVDRAFGFTSSVSKTIYTIILMNMYLKRKNPGAFAALPAEVGVSATPRPNPYNPVKPKGPIIEHNQEKSRVYTPHGSGSQVRVTYENGDTVIYHVPYQVPDFLY